MIGEIGGNLEAISSRWIKEHGTKPVVGFIAGETAPTSERATMVAAIIFLVANISISLFSPAEVAG